MFVDQAVMNVNSRYNLLMRCSSSELFWGIKMRNLTEVQVRRMLVRGKRDNQELDDMTM